MIKLSALQLQILRIVVAQEPVHRDTAWKNTKLGTQQGPKVFDKSLIALRDLGLIRKDRPTGLWESTTAGRNFVGD